MNDWRHFYEGMEEESDCGGDFGDGMRRHLRQLALHRGSGISIAVASPEGGLQREDVAVIADIVMAQSDYSLNDIRVVEVQ